MPEPAQTWERVNFEVARLTHAFNIHNSSGQVSVTGGKAIFLALFSSTLNTKLREKGRHRQPGS